MNAAQDAIPLEVIKLHTNTDPNLNAVRKAVESGDCSTDRVKPFLNIKEEIAVDHANGILLRGTRIIILSTLQANIISLAHKGHQVLAKTKASLREYAWFPSSDKAVKDELETCLPCQSTGPTNPPEPLQTPEMADGPWQTIPADFYGPLPTGQCIIVLIDKYSRYPEAEIINSTSAKCLIPKVDAIFARHGVSYKLKSDNGPPFNSNEFKSYLAKLGVKHETSTPEWQQGNL